MPNIYAVTAKK